VSEMLRRLISAALLGGFLAIAPSTAVGSAMMTPPGIVLGVGLPTPSVAIRPRR
jgi:hypothetical protein